MIERLLIVAALLLPSIVCADDLGKGEDIFNARCAQCHTLSRTLKMLNDTNPEERPTYLKKFLRSHPSKLNDDDEALVIRVLSEPGK